MARIIWLYVQQSVYGCLVSCTVQRGIGSTWVSSSIPTSGAVISCVTCRVLQSETHFEPILKCVSRYTATHLVLQLNIAVDC